MEDGTRLCRKKSIGLRMYPRRWKEKKEGPFRGVMKGGTKNGSSSRREICKLGGCEKRKGNGTEGIRGGDEIVRKDRKKGRGKDTNDEKEEENKLKIII